MRKLIMFNMMSLDGLFEGPDRELDWHNVDEEFNEFAIEQTGSAGLLIFGRTTYEMMAGFWSSQEALETEPAITGIMNSVPKVVFSRSLESADWINSSLVKTNPVDEIKRLKGQAGGDMYLFGSADLASDLIRHGLFDEYRIMVNPVILGRGHPLFKDLMQSVDLNLLKTRSFHNGNVLLYYQPREEVDSSLPPE